MRHVLLLATMTSIVLAGCAAPEYRASVLQFGEATEVAAAAQTKRFENQTDDQLAAIRGQLAENRVILSYSPECAKLALPGSDIGACVVVRRDGQELAQSERFTSIEALNKAVSDYGSSLSALAADVKEDSAAFSKSLTELATSVDGLNAALAGSETRTTDNAPRLQASANIIGGVGNAIFAGSRVAKLREIISRADPSIQEATQLLSRASEALTLNEVSRSIQRVERAETKLERAVQKGANTATIAKLQGQIFSEVDALRRTAAVKDTYVLIGEAHAILAEASRFQASFPESRASILELVALAKLLSAETKKF